MIEEKFGKAMEAGGKLTVRSALNPILWLCLIISAPATLLAARSDNPPIWLVVLIFLPVSVALIGYLFFMIFDRDKLQSEEFQIRKKTLEIYQKGVDKPLSIRSEELQQNPEMLQNHNNMGSNK